jgi:HSP20 family protein
MPVRWRGVSNRTVTIVARSGFSLSDLLAVAGSNPILAPTRWEPAVDVCETAESVVVTLELAGVREDELDIALYPDAVIVDGYRSLETLGPDVVYHALQIRHGPFRRELALPSAVDVDHPEVTFADGILRMALPKRAHGHVHREGRPGKGPSQ